jgi:integrase
LLEKPGAERSRDRVLTDDEIRLVWDACEDERPAMCALTRLRLMTAQRGGELSQLRWTDIEGDWLTIPGRRPAADRGVRLRLPWWPRR